MLVRACGVLAKKQVGSNPLIQFGDQAAGLLASQVISLSRVGKAHPTVLSN